jgi:hypothetical protein
MMLLPVLLACASHTPLSPPRTPLPVTLSAEPITPPVLQLTATGETMGLSVEGAWELTRTDPAWDPQGMRGRCRRGGGDFGGYSGLEWDDGLLAASDRGHLLWLSVEPPSATLSLLGDCGAESIRREGEDLWIVYEESRRVERYRPESGTAEADVGWQAGLTFPDDNTGMEAMAILPDGQRLILASGRVSGTPPDATLGRLIAADGHIVGTVTLPLSVVDGVPYTPTELATLPDGRLLLLERSWHNGQNRARLSLLAPTTLTDGATLSRTLLASMGPEQPIDNIEGLAVEPLPDGARLWLISDDNPQADTGQRVLLFSLRLKVTS